MPIPLGAVPFPQELDPGDVLDFHAALSEGPQDADPAPILLTGEKVASVFLTATSEAAALGLRVISGAYNGKTYPDPMVTADNVLIIWVGVDPSFQSARAYQDEGILLGIDMTIETNNIPPRTKNRTLVFRVRQLPGRQA